MNEIIKLGIDYSKYPHLHIEDSQRKINEISSVIPGYFRTRNYLDVGSDAGIITKAIGEQYRATRVDALDLSSEGVRLTQDQLRGFKESRVEQKSIEQYDTNYLYDLISFIDIVEHLEDPQTTLQKASTIGDFAVVRSPLEKTFMNSYAKSVHGVDYQKIMEERYGHIQHFDKSDMNNLLYKSGFDVIASKNFRVPHNADVLKRKSYKQLEQLSWRTLKRNYSDIWGGFYVAFCKSNQTRVVDEKSKIELLNILKEEFGEDNLVSLALFGSLASRNHNKYSDYDFTVILKNAPSNVEEREAASPRIKNRLREKKLNELCAFNIYTQSEFEAADQKNSWLIETMRNGNRILLDSDNYLKKKLSKNKLSINQVGPFAWEGINTETPERIMEVANRHKVVAEILKLDFPDFSLYHQTEGIRGELMACLLNHGVYNSRDSILNIAKQLAYKFNEDINLDNIKKLNYDQEIIGKPSLYRHDNIDRHLEAANLLTKSGHTQDALFHTYSALRSLYTRELHSSGIFALDGEITQLFLRERAKKLPIDLLQQVQQFSFKTEQLLGRTGYISFDLGSDGKSVFAEEGKEDIANLLKGLNLLVNNLRDNLKHNDEEITHNAPMISIAIATYNRPEHLEKCLDSLSNLIISPSNLEIVIVDDGSDRKYDIEKMRSKCPFTIKYVAKEHSGICATKNMAIDKSSGEYIAFIDDDMIVSPLWLVRLMSGFTNERIAGVGSTNLTYPDNSYLTEYSDYRELARRPFRDQTGEILNVLTGSACIKKSVLLKIGGFNQKQSNLGVPFGGDDVDITWNIRNLGYRFNYTEDSAVTFHNHRSTMKSFIKQHVGYGEGTMFHCIDKKRNPAELGIPEATINAVVIDLAKYLVLEVPKRIYQCHNDNLGFKKSISYPLLDLTRRFFYDLGILKASKHKKYEK